MNAPELSEAEAVQVAAFADVAKSRLNMYAEGYGRLRDYKSAVKDLEDFLASHPKGPTP